MSDIANRFVKSISKGQREREPKPLAPEEHHPDPMDTIRAIIESVGAQSNLINLLEQGKEALLQLGYSHACITGIPQKQFHQVLCPLPREGGRYSSKFILWFRGEGGSNIWTEIFDDKTITIEGKTKYVINFDEWHSNPNLIVSAIEDCLQNPREWGYVGPSSGEGSGAFSWYDGQH